MRRLRTQLMAGYALVALVGIGAVSFSANVLVDAQFQKLVGARIDADRQDYLEALPQAFEPGSGWNTMTLDLLGMDALAKGYVVRLTAADGAMVWDARTHNNGLCNAMIEHMAATMGARYPGRAGAYQEDSYPLTYGPGLGATVTFGLYGPVFFNDAEARFLEALNGWIAGAGVLSLVLSLLLGLLMARWISGPIAGLTAAARAFGRGDWSHPVPAGAQITEIVDLSQSIRSLGEGLQAQERLRQRLTADVSHELRSPLTVLQGRIEALLDGVWTLDRTQLEFIHQEVLRLTRLVGQLESLTQLDGGQTALVPTVLDATELLASLVDPFQVEARARGLAVVAVGGGFTFVADADRTRQILFNLVSNAVKYTPDGGRVTVTGRAEPGGVWFTVTDTGIGIAPEDLPHIFDRFYRADPSRTRATGGAGLGLAIARSWAEAQGGTLTVTSQVGEGTTMTLSLPPGAQP